MASELSSSQEQDYLLVPKLEPSECIEPPVLTPTDGTSGNWTGVKVEDSANDGIKRKRRKTSPVKRVTSKTASASSSESPQQDSSELDLTGPEKVINSTKGTASRSFKPTVKRKGSSKSVANRTATVQRSQKSKKKSNLSPKLAETDQSVMASKNGTPSKDVEEASEAEQSELPVIEPNFDENDDLSDESDTQSTDSSSNSDESEWKESKDAGASASRKSRKGFSPKGPYRCNECNQQWPLKNDYNQHLVDVHNVKVRVYKPVRTKRTPHTFVCDVCAAVFKVKTLFIKHMNDEHNLEKAFKCPVCVARFTGPRNMNGHYNKYHNAEDGTKYFCDHCPKVFFLKNRLKRHMATHRSKEEVGNTQCTLCGIDYGSRQSLAQHMSFTHALRKKTFVCEHCGKTYGSTHELKKHVNKHTEENVYPCDRCEVKFLTSSKLKAHELKVHAGIEFKCELCSKHLSCLRNLKCHIKTVHLNQPSVRARRYQCPHCDLKCQSPAQRDIHLRQVHLKEKPFLCHLCDKRFCSQKLLSRHLDVHYEYKPHVCPHCGKAFSQKSNMEMHARTHTGEKPYICVECGKGFTQSSNLKVHMKQHGINLETKSRVPARNSVEVGGDEDTTRLALIASLENRMIPEVCMDTESHIDDDQQEASENQRNDDKAGEELEHLDAMPRIESSIVPEVCIETPNNGSWNLMSTFTESRR